MADLIESLGLAAAIANAGFSNSSDFESLYDEIATSGKAPGLKDEIEAKVQAYFEALELPEPPTLYDHLVLSLRDSDYIATFNWDPFLAQAFSRNRQAARMPKLLFLHGNVEVGICPVDRFVPLYWKTPMLEFLFRVAFLWDRLTNGGESRIPQNRQSCPMEVQ